jgi:hypothetical protein
MFYDGQLHFSSSDVGSCCLGIVMMVVVVVELPTKVSLLKITSEHIFGARKQLLNSYLS